MENLPISQEHSVVRLGLYNDTREVTVKVGYSVIQGPSVCVLDK